MWKYKDGRKFFTGGKDDYQQAATIAAACEHFAADVEDEWVCEDACSCYNCRYRRWTSESFQCMK